MNSSSISCIQIQEVLAKDAQFQLYEIPSMHADKVPWKWCHEFIQSSSQKLQHVLNTSRNIHVTIFYFIFRKGEKKMKTLTKTLQSNEEWNQNAQTTMLLGPTQSKIGIQSSRISQGSWDPWPRGFIHRGPDFSQGGMGQSSMTSGLGNPHRAPNPPRMSSSIPCQFN